METFSIKKESPLFPSLYRGSLRGLRKCLKCKTVSGSRGKVCKSCGTMFVRQSKESSQETSDSNKSAVDVDCSKYVAARLFGHNTDTQIFSVHNTSNGRCGFVQLFVPPQPDDNLQLDNLENNTREAIDDVEFTDPDFSCDVDFVNSASSCDGSGFGDDVLPGGGRCLFPMCENRLSGECVHIKACQQSTEVATSLKYMVTHCDDNDTKEVIISASPLIQRICRNLFVMRCAATKSHPLGFVHIMASGRVPYRQYRCNCGDWQDLRRCVHSCACADAEMEAELSVVDSTQVVGGEDEATPPINTTPPPPHEQQQQADPDDESSSDHHHPPSPSLKDLTWSCADWLGGVVERIHSFYELKAMGKSTRTGRPLTYVIPNIFMDGLLKGLPPHSKQMHTRSPLLAPSVMSVWSLTQEYQIKDFFSLASIPLDMERPFASSSGTSWIRHEYFQPSRGSLSRTVYVGVAGSKAKPFVVEWTPDAYPESHLGHISFHFQLNVGLKPANPLHRVHHSREHSNLVIPPKRQRLIAPKPDATTSICGPGSNSGISSTLLVIPGTTTAIRPKSHCKLTLNTGGKIPQEVPTSSVHQFPVFISTPRRIAPAASTMVKPIITSAYSTSSTSSSKSANDALCGNMVQCKVPVSSSGMHGVSNDDNVVSVEDSVGNNDLLAEAASALRTEQIMGHDVLDTSDGHGGEHMRTSSDEMESALGHSIDVRLTSQSVCDDVETYIAF